MSSIVFLNSGQCGNQLGYNVVDYVYNHFSSNLSKPGVGSIGSSSSSSSIDAEMDLELFFRRGKKNPDKLYARSVCLDTEPKVVNDCMAKSKLAKERWEIDARSVAYRHGGAGNNWAMGYSMFSGEFLDISVDLIRRELEHCDTNPMIISTHSVAGGTGSGLGTRVSECVRDEFPDSTLVNIAVLPYHFGEVVVQYYNTILCLSKILSSSNGIILYENEVAFDICRKTRGIDRPTLADINNTMASQLSSVIVPKQRLFDISSSTSNSRNSRTILSDFDDDISHLCCHSHFRLLDVKSVPQTFDRSKEYTFDSWRSLIRSISRMQLYGSYSDRVTSNLSSIATGSKALSPPAKAHDLADNSVSRSSASVGDSLNTCKTLSAVMTCRGADVTDPANRREIEEVHSVMECSSLASKSSDAVKVCYDRKLSNGYQRSISVLSNSQAILPTVSRALSRGKEMFDVRAYVHQYRSNGLEEGDFHHAFHKLGQVVEGYSSL